MSTSGTGRYGLREAPPGPRFVQDFVNTKSIGNYGPDLLSSIELAQPWLDQALADWSSAREQDVPEITLSEDDLAALQDMRSRFEQLLRGDEINTPEPSKAVLH